MSNPSDQTLDLSALVATLTEAVLRSLDEGSAPRASGSGVGAAMAPETRRIGWVLASPTGHLEPVGRELGVLARVGHHQQVLACPDVVDGLRRCATWPGESERLVLSALGERGQGVSAVLAALSELEILYVGALGWQQAAELAALNDGDDFVRVLMAALTAGTPVRVLAGAGLQGLHGLPPGGGAGGAAPILARRATELWRGLELLGVTPISLDDLRRPLETLAAGATSWGRSLGGLLTERDVEEAAAAGLRELRLPAGTQVTPLARDRARALDVKIERG